MHLRFLTGLLLAVAGLAALPAAETAETARPALLIAGDSTAARGSGGQQGWGVPIPAYFDPARVEVVNGARGGRSSRTFITDGSWSQVIGRVRPGDVVLIQFGHNDGGATNAEPPGSGRPLRARGTLPGLGEETEEIDNVLTKKHEVVHTFGWYVRTMLREVRAKGGQPVLLSLTVRNHWKDGRIERGNGRYGEWTAALARAEQVPFVDLTRLVADELERLGEQETARLFQPDRTHPNAAGAELHARWVVAGLKALSPNPVAGWLSAAGAAVPAAR